MINILNKKTEDRWYIAHNMKDVFHFGLLLAGSELKTGQPYVEEFKTEEEIADRLAFLTKDPKYYEKYLDSIKDEEEDEDYDEYADFDLDKEQI
jgi:hypothetical protein